MGDSGSLRRKPAKGGNGVNRIVSLFEIPRPNKGKGLQRTNSLPSSKNIASSDEGSLYGTLGKVQKIREEIEHKAHQVQKKKHAKKRLDQEKWVEDREKIMDDLNRLHERIEDVTPEIERSDTELEIIHARTSENDEGDKFREEDTETVMHDNRLSGDTIIADDNEASYVSIYTFTGEKEDAPVAAAEIPDQAEPDSIDWWKHKSFVQINKELEPPPSPPPPALGGRFIKNNRSKRNKRSDRRRTGIIQKPCSVKELAKHFEGFKEAAESGETETYRKSFIDEMDKELENMRNDGFREDFHLSFENLTLLDDVDEDDDNNLHEEEALFIVLPNTQEVQEQDDDLFGETLFSEDLENGLYYLETYNADGKELIMCSVQIDRRSVDLNSFDEIKARPNSNVLTNDEHTLVLMEGAEGGSKSGSDSKRTTIYSTTSGESYDDEGIDIVESNPYNYARRETYCDDQGVVRIERVAPYTETPDYVNMTNNYYFPGQDGYQNAADEENYYESIRLEHEILFSAPQVKKETLQYILEEIKSTERKYVRDMGKVLREYKTFLEERYPEKVDVVFANMDQIYKVQLEFLRALEESEWDVKEIVQAFIDFEDLFRLYPRYFRNTPKANAAVKELSFLIKEKQERINDKLDLSAYLLTPLQRLGKYKLFLENIIKQLEKEERPVGFVQIALEMVKKYMSKGNDAVAIASIQYSPLHTKDYGSFISREKFLLYKPRRMELMVFLFEGTIVFTTEDPKNMEQFVYHQSIKTNDLRIATFDDNTIHLTDYTKTKKRNSSKYTYVLDAKNPKLKAAWKQQIEDILWKQMKKIKENTLKEYQNGTKKPKKAIRSREQRSKSTGSSIFYVE